MKRMARTLIAAGALAMATGGSAQAGWYLIVPPAYEDTVYETAPLGDWVRLGAFDTARECTDQQVGLQARARVKTNAQLRELDREIHGEGRAAISDKAYKLRASYSQCIESNDAQLTTIPKPSVSNMKELP
jgi:hypothetical protein